MVQVESIASSRKVHVLSDTANFSLLCHFCFVSRIPPSTLHLPSLAIGTYWESLDSAYRVYLPGAQRIALCIVGMKLVLAKL